MLVLTRKINERILIGDDITITITAVRDKNTVQLGIEAPAYIKIVREELHKTTPKKYQEKRRG
jgi:carbon storage regulator